MRLLPSLFVALVGACSVPDLPESLSPVSGPPEPVRSRMATPTAVPGPASAARAGQDGRDSVPSAWIPNPSTGARLAVYVQAPRGPGPFPTLVVSPGGLGDGDALQVTQKIMFWKAGFALVSLDVDGRGRSEGTEDFGGTFHQDAFAAALLYAATRPEVDPARIGVLSFSYGVTMASGALARWETPAKFLLDWEGPPDRSYTRGCGRPEVVLPEDPSRPFGECSDDTWWATREAIRFVPLLRMPYQRVQFDPDHAQPANTHALAVVNAAVDGGVPWVRLDGMAPNTRVAGVGQASFIPLARNATLRAEMVAGYAKGLMEMVSGRAVAPATPPVDPATLPPPAGKPVPAAPPPRGRR